MTAADGAILLVEDNQDDIDLTLHSLQRENLANSISVVRDGEEALDFLFCRGTYADRASKPLPRLVLLDLRLPKVDGIEVLRQIKGDPHTKTIPVVMLTSSREERDLVNNHNLGANSYIQKPVDFDQFRQIVKSLGPDWLVINQGPVGVRVAKPEAMTVRSKTEEAAAEKIKLRLVIVEGNSADSELVQLELRRSGFDLISGEAQTAEQFREALRKNTPDVVLADYNLGQWRGMETLEIMRQEGIEAPLILVSGALGDVTAVECIKSGATDYVLKDALTRLPISIHRALEEKRLREERKQAVEALAKKAEALARSNQDLEQFAYVASHDLQEPLRMVASYTQLLADRYKGKLDEKADKYIGYVVEGAIRMQTLINDLLAFSRAGRAGMEMEDTDCNRVVENALTNLQAAVDESGALVMHEGLPHVLGNPQQLQHMFQNLIGNGIKFRGGDAPLIQIEAEGRALDWWFSVRDNGIGIAPEYADAIFTIFKRLHTRTEYSGNGIGLSICKKIIEQHGGKIWVQTHEGPGTTFKFTLPALPAKAQPRPVQKVENPDENHAASLAG